MGGITNHQSSEDLKSPRDHLWLSAVINGAKELNNPMNSNI